MKVFFSAILIANCAWFLTVEQASEPLEVWGGACGTYSSSTADCLSGAQGSSCTGTTNCSTKHGAGTCPTQSVQYTKISAGTVQMKATSTNPCGTQTVPSCFYDTAIQACNTHATQTETRNCKTEGAYNITTGGCGGST